MTSSTTFLWDLAVRYGHPYLWFNVRRTELVGKLSEPGVGRRQRNRATRVSGLLNIQKKALKKKGVYYREIDITRSTTAYWCLLHIICIYIYMSHL